MNNFLSLWKKMFEETPVVFKPAETAHTEIRKVSGGMHIVHSTYHSPRPVLTVSWLYTDEEPKQKPKRVEYVNREDSVMW